MRLAVIPARGGSKRVPRKNLRDFCGRPMIARPIEAAIAAGCFDDVVVSTDDDDIAQVARETGASVPFRRPAELAGDTVGTRPVLRHVIDWFAAEGRPVELLACVYATAAFVRPDDLRAATEQLSTSNAGFVVSVTAYAHPIERAMRIRADGRLEMISPEAAAIRTQDLAAAFHDAAQFYVGRATAFRSDEPALSRAAVPFVLPRYRVHDIDSEEDWTRAEVAYRALDELGELR